MSCLFNSISYFIDENSYNIRQKICDYLENNYIIIEGLETKDILAMESNNYISNMRNITTWGGAIEIQAACNIWNMSIVVYDLRNNLKNKIVFIPINSDIDKTIELEWNGGHYEPIKK